MIRRKFRFVFYTSTCVRVFCLIFTLLFIFTRHPSQLHAFHQRINIGRNHVAVECNWMKIIHWWVSILGPVGMARQPLKCSSWLPIVMIIIIYRDLKQTFRLAIFSHCPIFNFGQIDGKQLAKLCNFNIIISTLSEAYENGNRLCLWRWKHKFISQMRNHSKSFTRCQKSSVHTISEVSNETCAFRRNAAHVIVGMYENENCYMHSANVCISTVDDRVDDGIRYRVANTIQCGLLTLIGGKVPAKSTALM